MMDKKKYLDVLASFTREGKILPRQIRWDDGTRYDIERILDFTPGASTKRGGSDRYSVQIRGRSSYLYYEHNPIINDPMLGRWYVEVA